MKKARKRSPSTNGVAPPRGRQAQSDVGRARVDRPARKRPPRAAVLAVPETHRVRPSNERLSFEYIPIDALTCSKRTLSKQNDRQHRQLMSSLATYGFLSPLVATAENELIVGEKRWAAAREIGFESVPVVRACWLTPLQIRQYRIADNRLNELREWDASALKAELEEIIVLDPDVNIEALGYEVAEFDVALQAVTEAGDPADISPEPPAEPYSRLGDIWEVDGHRLGCGDARDADFLVQVIADAEVRCVFADPPFNRVVKGHIGGKGRIKHAEFVMGSGELTDQEFQQFQIDWMKAVAGVLAPGGLMYVASDWRALFATLAAGSAADFEQINFCTWELTVPRMGSFYRSACEYFPIWRKPGGKSRNNIMLGATGRHRSSCWHYPGANSFGSGRENLHLHPTVKPLALCQDILLDCTARGEFVLDPFLGSGTTLIAAERSGRKARGIELDPRYVDVAVRRYQQVFGRAPRLVATGKTLDELVAQRVSEQTSAEGQVALPDTDRLHTNQPRARERGRVRKRGAA